MSTNNQLAVVAAPSVIATGTPQIGQPKTLAEIRAIAETLVASGFFKDVRSVSQACTKMIAGMALGYDAVTSMNAFHIIEGKITLTAGEVGARIKRSGKYNYRVTQLDETGAIVVFMERDGERWMDIGTSTFTKQDAINAGLAGKAVWKSYFRNMSFSRCMTNGARWFCPDVFGGPVYTPEELGADVTIIDGEMVVLAGDTPSAPAATAPTATSPAARPPSGAEVKALYADARRLRPELPEDIKAWAATAIDGYDPSRNPTSKMVLAMDVALRAMLAEGATAVDTPETTAPVPQDAAEQPLEATFTEVHSRAAEGSGRPLPSSHGNGPALTSKTRGRLFAQLADIGIGQPADTSVEEKERARAERLNYLNSFGLNVRSMADLSEEQGTWLAQRLDDEICCAACRQKIGLGEAHAKGCPEADA